MDVFFFSIHTKSRGSKGYLHPMVMNKMAISSTLFADDILFINDALVDTLKELDLNFPLLAFSMILYSNA